MDYLDKLFAQNWIEQFRRKWYISNRHGPSIIAHATGEDYYNRGYSLFGKIQNWGAGEGRPIWTRRCDWFGKTRNVKTR